MKHLGLLIQRLTLRLPDHHRDHMEAPLSRTIRATSSLSVRCQRPRAAQCLPLPRHLHITTTRQATPVPHPTVLGPPPQAPQAAVSNPPDRVARKRSQAEALQQSQQAKVNPAKPTSALQKRFWKNVSVKEGEDGTLQVLLDTRPVRTAARRILTLPKRKRALAGAIAMEWDQLVTAQQALKHHYIPLTSLTSRSLDIEAADSAEGADNKIRQSIITTLMRYLGTDTLLCWAPVKNAYGGERQEGTKPLRERQKEIAEPIIAHLTAHVFPGLEIVPILGEDSIVPISQPEITQQVIRGWIAGLPAIDLAALERGTLATKSLLIGARLLVEWSEEFAQSRDVTSTEAGRFDIDKATEAASLEVLHQTEEWGEVDDTHDVDREDMRRQLGSVILLVT